MGQNLLSLKTNLDEKNNLCIGCLVSSGRGDLTVWIVGREYTGRLQNIATSLMQSLRPVKGN